MNRMQSFCEKLQSAAIIVVTLLCVATSSMAQELVCWFVPGSSGTKAKAITDALAKESGLAVTPRVAAGYPEIFEAFSKKENALVYAGSFTAALLNARGLAVPLVQKIDGKELYSGVMIYSEGSDPMAILKDNPAEISYAKGASAGESAARAATGGKASIAVKDHAGAANAVKVGKAKAAFLKNWWWEANKDKYPGLAMKEIEGVSERKNPDNLLMASTSTSPDLRDKVTKAALASKEAFGAAAMTPFEVSQLDFPLDLMKKGGIDPGTYDW